METSVLRRRLIETSVYDVNFHSVLSTDNGDKISIQGKTVEDSLFLYKNLHEYLYAGDIPFKLATVNRYALLNRNKEQSHKAMTIYIPNGYDLNGVCEDIYSRIIDYKGWYDIKTPTSYVHYAGGLYTRNDRNENGGYIPANK
jgi:hypothetical protein